MWELREQMTVVMHASKGIVQAGGLNNYYPACSVSGRVSRLTAFYIYNVVLPMGVFSFLACLTPFTMSHE